MQLTVHGRRYELVWCPNLANDGECDAPHLHKKKIRIASRVRKKGGQYLLQVLAHEFLHAGDWHKTEEWVDSVSTDLARFLYRLGYRLESEGQA